MALFVYPNIKTATIEDFENHIAAVRARRIAAATTFYEGQNAKLQYASDKMQKKIMQQRMMLEKELAAMDKATEKVEERVHRIATMQQENETLMDMQTQTGDWE